MKALGLRLFLWFASLLFINLTQGCNDMPNDKVYGATVPIGQPGDLNGRVGLLDWLSPDENPAQMTLSVSASFNDGALEVIDGGQFVLFLNYGIGSGTVAVTVEMQAQSIVLPVNANALRAEIFWVSSLGAITQPLFAHVRIGWGSQSIRFPAMQGDTLTPLGAGGVVRFVVPRFATAVQVFRTPVNVDFDTAFMVGATVIGEFRTAINALSPEVKIPPLASVVRVTLVGPPPASVVPIWQLQI